MRFSFLGSLLTLALPLAALGEHFTPHRRHSDIAHRARADTQLQKRSFDNARLTFYDVGLGSCGQYSQPSDFIVALNSAQYGDGYPGPNCFKSITITCNGKSTGATILDECPGCPYGGLDLSTGLFDFFADPSVGVLYCSWDFDGDAPAPTSTSAPPPPPPPTTSSSTWSSTSSSTPPPSSSSSSTKSSTTQSSTQSSASSSAPPSSSSSSASAATPTPSATNSTSSTDGNLANCNQAILGLGGALVAAGGAQ